VLPRTVLAAARHHQDEEHRNNDGGYEAGYQEPPRSAVRFWI
jgi:hypothetical protein